MTYIEAITHENIRGNKAKQAIINLVVSLSGDDHLQAIINVSNDAYRMRSLYLAIKAGVPEALADMLQVGECIRKMREIRVAYISGVGHAAHDMVRASRHWEGMQAVREEATAEMNDLII